MDENKILKTRIIDELVSEMETIEKYFREARIDYTDRKDGFDKELQWLLRNIY